MEKKPKRKYENDIKLFKHLSTMTKNKLQKSLYGTLKNFGYKKIINTNMYLIAEGELPICLCAHMDTVFNYVPYKFYYDEQETTLWSPSGMGADDRAGILIILKLLKMGFRPSIVFTDLEEKGGLGADKLVSDYGECPFPNCKALIQLDRRGYNDSVYYNCANKEFESLINSYGFKTNWGTFSDISLLAPIWEIAGVNLSVGYENEHTCAETLNVKYMNNTLYKVKRILEDCNEWNMYSYIEEKNNKYIDIWDTFFNSSNAEKCVCCGEVLTDYYSCKYENEILKMCPSCYALCFAPGPADG